MALVPNVTIVKLLLAKRDLSENPDKILVFSFEIFKMKKLSFFFLFVAEKTVCSRSYYYYGYGYDKEDPYAESPCYSDNHNCHPTENCVPEGQHLYQCCDTGYKYDYSTHCRQGNREFRVERVEN